MKNFGILLIIIGTLITAVMVIGAAENTASQLHGIEYGFTVYLVERLPLMIVTALPITLGVYLVHRANAVNEAAKHIVAPVSTPSVVAKPLAVKPVETKSYSTMSNEDFGKTLGWVNPDNQVAEQVVPTPTVETKLSLSTADIVAAIS